MKKIKMNIDRLKLKMKLGGMALLTPFMLAKPVDASSITRDQLYEILNENPNVNFRVTINGSVYRGSGRSLIQIIGFKAEEKKLEGKKVEEKKEKREEKKGKEVKAPTKNTYSEEVLKLVNKERREKGLSELTHSSEMQRVADIRAEEASILWAHERPGGKEWNSLSKKHNGENLGMGYKTPEDVVRGWMNSPSHRENILNPRYKTLGVGVYKAKDGTMYWSQAFSRSN